MLAVQPQRFQLPRDEISSMDSCPSLQSTEPEILQKPSKQIQQNSQKSPYKLLIAIGIIFLVGIVSYKIYDSLVITQPPKSQITQLHGKIIQHADTSSSKDRTSNTGSGSTSSKTSKSNDKPNSSSLPASKTPISSNNNFLSSSSSDDGGKDDQEENDGDKNKKILDNGKTKSQTTGSKTKLTQSTTEDSQSVESDEDGFTTQGLMFPGRQDGPAPLIGSTRG